MANITTGVIVDHAIQHRNNDRAVRLAKETRQRTAFLNDIMDLLDAMDVNKDGNISIREWNQCLLNPSIQALVASVGIDEIDVASIFNLIDVEGSGSVNVVQLIEAFHKLRGSASSIDIQVLMSRINFCIVQMGKLMETVDTVDHQTKSIERVLPEIVRSILMAPSNAPRSQLACHEL